MYLLVYYNTPLWNALGLALLVYTGSVRLSANQQGSSQSLTTPEEALPPPDPEETRQEVTPPGEPAHLTPPSRWSSLAFWLLFHSVQATLLLLFVHFFGKKAGRPPNSRSYLLKGLPGVVLWQVVAKAYLTLLGPAPPLHVAQAGWSFRGITGLFFCLPFGVYLWGAWTGFLMAPKQHPWPYGNATKGIDYLLGYLVVSLFTPLVYASMRERKTPDQEEEMEA